jgi:hypothetical protein
VKPSTTEKNLRELQVLLITYNIQTVNTKKQSEAQIDSPERVYVDAKQTISRQHVQIDELQRCLAVPKQKQLDTRNSQADIKQLSGNEED